MVGILVFGYGNPGRGDDVLGPVFVEQLQSQDKGEYVDVECLTDMQLQVEHVTDLCERKLVLFVDADASCPPPFRMSRIHATKDTSYTSHAMSPKALLYAYRQVYGLEPPPTFLLRIRGYGFDLGDSLSVEARSNLDEALKVALELCADPVPERWLQFAESMEMQA